MDLAPLLLQSSNGNGVALNQELECKKKSGNSEFSVEQHLIAGSCAVNLKRKKSVRTIEQSKIYQNNQQCGRASEIPAIA